MNNSQINTDDVIAASTIFLLSFTAIVWYSIILVSIYKIWKKTKNAFYILLIPLGLTDSCMLASFAFYSTPATILRRPLFGREVEKLLLGTLCNFTYFSSLSMLINIAINRYWSICCNSTSLKDYDVRKVFASIAFCLLFGTLSAIPQMTPCCSIMYFENDYTWGYDMDLDGNGYYVWYDRSCNLIGFIALLTLYGLIVRTLVRVRRTSTVHAAATNNNGSRSTIRTEAHLAMQSAMNSALMIVACILFTVVPSLTTSKWANLSTSIVYIATIGIHPFVYFAFNKVIRKEVVDLIPCLERCSKMQAMVMPNPTSAFVKAAPQ